MSLAEEKQRLRDVARIRRSEAAADASAAAEKVSATLIGVLADLDPRPAGGTVPPPAVAAYWAVGSEMATEGLLNRLHGNGHACALPVVTAAGAPLVFRTWAPGTALDAGPLGTLAPGSGQPEIAPDIVLVPLLAFDARGCRLGQGGGYYDRTLARLRESRPVAAVGLAFARQEVYSVPRAPHDQPLDWVVTEQGAVRFGDGG